MTRARIAGCALAVATLPLAGCGGSDDEKKPAAKKGGPTIQQTVAVSRKNPGLAKCKKVSYGLLDNTPESEREPLVIMSVTCDGRTVGIWERYKSESFRAADEGLQHRPYLVNGPIKVSTGEAIFAHIDAEAWKTMPAELQAACGCGQVKTPKS